MLPLQQHGPSRLRVSMRVPACHGTELSRLQRRQEGRRRERERRVSASRGGATDRGQVDGVVDPAGHARGPLGSHTAVLARRLQFVRHKAVSYVGKIGIGDGTAEQLITGHI